MARAEGRAEAVKYSPRVEREARLVYQTIAGFGWDISWKHDRPVPDDAWPIDIIAAAIIRAENRGGRIMSAEAPPEVDGGETRR